MTNIIEVNEEVLQVVYDSRKSFYGKAHVLTKGVVMQLRSYDTIVAAITNGKATVYGTYSPTTLRHIKEFLSQNDFEVGTKSQIEEMYIDKIVSK